MSLLDLKSYLKQHNQIALIDIANHFGVQIDTVKSMISHWINKGRVKMITGQYCNKGCCKANPENLVMYEWIEDEKAIFLKYQAVKSKNSK